MRWNREERDLSFSSLMVSRMWISFLRMMCAVVGMFLTFFFADPCIAKVAKESGVLPKVFWPSKIVGIVNGMKK